MADAMEARHIAWNPAAAAKAPKLTAVGDPRVWTAAEVGRFLAHVQADRLGALWILAASTGMRRGELLGLRWRDVDLDGAELRIRQTYVAYGRLRVFKEPKTERARRTIPLTPRVVSALKAHRKAQSAERLAAGPAYADHGLVFPDEIGRPLSPDAVSAAFVRLARDLGLPPLTLHGLRHSFATVGLERDVDVLYVSALLGHSSPAITQGVYQHVRRGRLSQAADTIGDAISE
jgi:integrase